MPQDSYHHKIETSPLVTQSFEVALFSQSHSHSPYSKFPVGACVKFKGDESLYGGCNVENASFGATICAERSAILSAISVKGRQNIEFLTIVANTTRPTPPCALCLQVMSEFNDGDFPVYLSNQKGILKKLNFSELLPITFDTLFD